MEKNVSDIFYKRLYIASVVILVLTALRGIRFPNLWSYSHFLFDYEFGFVRRGLIGSVLDLFDSAWLYSYGFFFIISMAISIANLVLLSLTFRELIGSRNVKWITLVFIYASSSGIVFLSHHMGYADQIGLLITLVFLRISGFRNKLLFITPALAIGMLIHEGIVVMFFPVIFMTLFFSMPKESQQYRYAFAGFTVFIMMMFFYTSSSTLDESQSLAMIERASQLTETPLREDAFALLHDTGSGSLADMLGKWANPNRVFFLLLSFLVILPLSTIIQYIMLKTMKEQSLAVRCLCVLACFSPLTLHLVAWDTMRFTTLVLTTSYLMAYAVYKYSGNAVNTGGEIPVYRWASLPLLILVLYFNANTYVLLLGGGQVENFPYPNHLAYLAQVLKGEKPFPDIPEK